jgi:hypothetical protein
VEPTNDIAIVEFEAFSTSLSRSEDLHSTILNFSPTNGSPTEGRDSTVQYDRATANGISIESEVFYATSTARPG